MNNHWVETFLITYMFEFNVERILYEQSLLVAQLEIQYESTGTALPTANNIPLKWHKGV